MFSGAHYIEDYQGECSRLHGHNYKVEVIVEGEELDNCGMLIDAKVLKSMLKEVVSRLDHRVLNEALGCGNATAELLARSILEELRDLLNFCSLTVRIYETPEIWVEVVG